MVHIFCSLFADSFQGYHEKRLLNNLLNNYNLLERPVANESEALEVRFGLTLQQIIDVVSNCIEQFLQNSPFYFFYFSQYINITYFVLTFVLLIWVSLTQEYVYRLAQLVPLSFVYSYEINYSDTTQVHHINP